MKCVWVVGAGSFLAVVFVLALLPCLVPAPIGGDAGRGIANAATSSVFVNEVQYAKAAEGEPVPVAMTFTTNRPQVVGRLYVNEQGKLAFEGDVEASAKAFLDEVMKQAEARRSSAAEPR